MERAFLRELGFCSRNEALRFLKALWHEEKTACPICGGELVLLHKKAKKSSLDWQCPSCGKIYRTLYLLDELNEQMPD